MSSNRDNRVQRLRDLRRAQQAGVRRTRILLTLGAIVVVIAVAIGVTLAVRTSGSGGGGSSAGVTSAQDAQQIIPATVTGKTTTETAPKKVPDTSGIKGDIAWDTAGWPGDGKDHRGALQHQHVTGPVTYTELPPVGGPHNAIWMNAGVYTKAIPTERAVHNMEHGAVWITYNPDLPAGKVAQLVAFVAKQSLIDESQATQVAGQANRYLDLSPWPTASLPSPIVLSAWGHQLRVTSPTDPRMQKFVDTFRNSATYTPEHGSAVDGIPVQTGGRPATYGSTKPNPPGTANNSGM